MSTARTMSAQLRGKLQIGSSPEGVRAGVPRSFSETSAEATSQDTPANRRGRAYVLDVDSTDVGGLHRISQSLFTGARPFITSCHFAWDRMGSMGFRRTHVVVGSSCKRALNYNRVIGVFGRVLGEPLAFELCLCHGTGYTACRRLWISRVCSD